MISKYYQKKLINVYNIHKKNYKNENFYYKFYNNINFFNNFLNESVSNVLDPLLIERQSKEEGIALCELILFLLNQYYENDVTVYRLAFHSIFVVILVTIERACGDINKDPEILNLLEEIQQKYPTYYISYILSKKK